MRVNVRTRAHRQCDKLGRPAAASNRRLGLAPNRVGQVMRLRRQQDRLGEVRLDVAVIDKGVGRVVLQCGWAKNGSVG